MIYFITAREIGRVKIGFSGQPRLRLSKMQSDSPCELRMERLIEGGVEVEADLHDRFEARRIAGEWFHLSADVEAYMAALPEPAPAKKGLSPQQMLIRATGCSASLASQVLSPKYPGHRMTFPAAIAVFRMFGERLGPIVDATDAEIDVLEKFLCSNAEAAA